MRNSANITTTPLFGQLYGSDKRIAVCQGGTSSGKTYTILQVLLLIASANAKQVVTVVGQDVPNIKVGAWRDAKRIVSDNATLQRMFVVSEGFLQLRCLNGSVVEFKSYANEQDARSGKRDYLFVNEANGISYEVYWQLAIRTRRRIFIDYNPSARFWVHDKIICGDDVLLTITDHRHNPFLSAEEHDRIEGISDPELWRVYARGLTGRIQGVIYNDITVVDRMPETYKGRWLGLDFGYNDPTALIDVRLSEGKIWTDEVLYHQYLTNHDIYKAIASAGLLGVHIIADSAEPKSIEELRRLGCRIEPARKGADSVRVGISTLLRYSLCVTRRSANIRKELNNYKWKVDGSGNITNEPVDMFNHSLDALRYVALNRLQAPSRRASIKSGKL